MTPENMKLTRNGPKIISTVAIITSIPGSSMLAPLEQDHTHHAKYVGSADVFYSAVRAEWDLGSRHRCILSRLISIRKDTSGFRFN